MTESAAAVVYEQSCVCLGHWNAGRWETRRDSAGEHEGKPSTGNKDGGRHFSSINDSVAQR